MKTPLGPFAIYGTIIGIYGNRRPSFMTDLEEQVKDYKRIADMCGLICIAGDYNLSFGDNYYYTKDGRNAIINAFKEQNILNLTTNIINNIDHIATSKMFLKDKNITAKVFASDRRLSDHIGVMVDIV